MDQVIAVLRHHKVFRTDSGWFGEPDMITCNCGVSMDALDHPEHQAVMLQQYVLHKESQS